MTIKEDYEMFSDSGSFTGNIGKSKMMGIIGNS